LHCILGVLGYLAVKEGFRKNAKSRYCVIWVKTRFENLMNVLDYIDETKSPEVRKLLLEAHNFLLESLPPFAICLFRWKIPFYKLNRNLCYLNRHKDHITLGFTQGYKFVQRPKIFLGEADKLKQIRYLEIFKIEDLYSDITQQILQEAILVDEMLGKPKSRTKRFSRLDLT
jgi:hypothetical protein